MGKSSKEFDQINPIHYKKYTQEVWKIMLKVWGKEAYIAFCEMNSFKYRMRAGDKPTASIEKDIEKARWYEQLANRLRNEGKEGNNISDNISNT